MKKILPTLIVVTCLGLAGCSSSVDQPGDQGSRPSQQTPSAPEENQPENTPQGPTEPETKESLEDKPDGNFNTFTADQSSSEGAVRLYLESLAKAEVSTTCQVIDPAVINRLETVNSSCEETYQGGAVPFTYQDLPKLSLQEKGPSADGRGLTVSITGPRVEKQITVLESEGTWYVDPESFRNIAD